MGSLERRLEALEALTDDTALAELEFPDWPIEDQLQDVAGTLHLFMRFHSMDSRRYAATDRELHLLGILCAAAKLRELGPDGGEYTFPFGLTVRLIPEGEPEGESFLIDAPRHIRADDLPDWTHEHFERMEPAKQPERDSWLHALRHYFKRERKVRPKREEERRLGSEESMRRDRELLECNRAS